MSMSVLINISVCVALHERNPFCTCFLKDFNVHGEWEYKDFRFSGIQRTK